MRSDRVERAKQDGHAFVDHGACAFGCVVLEGIKGIEHLHGSRDNGVVLHAV